MSQGVLAGTLKRGAKVVVEMSNVRTERGVRAVAWDAARMLAEIFRFEGEIVRCNTGPEPAGPGYQHSYLLLFAMAYPASDGESRSTTCSCYRRSARSLVCRLTSG